MCVRRGAKAGEFVCDTYECVRVRVCVRDHDLVGGHVEYPREGIVGEEDG